VVCMSDERRYSVDWWPIGSTVVYPHGDERLRPIELGASIFVDANKHMMKAAKVSNRSSMCCFFGNTCKVDD
jgi:hypothetical protein